MALVDTVWYTNFGNGTSTGYYAVAQRAASTAVAAGAIRRQFTTPAVGSERVFVCIVAGTTSASADATWVLTRGAKTTDGTVTWQECSGQAALNGDLANTTTWAQVKAATPAVLGQVIKRSNNASYQICTTAGAMSASEPAFSDTAGVTTTDTTAVWTSLGAVSNFTGGQAPHTRLNNVFGTNWFASGNTVYVGDNHAETQSTAMSFTASSALMAQILCHNRSGSYPPAASDLTTGATITVTGAAGVFINLGFVGSFYLYGITFKQTVSGAAIFIASAATVGAIQNWQYYDNCSFDTVGIGGASGVLGFGTGAAATWNICTLNNTTVKFSTSSAGIGMYQGLFTWRNTGQVLVSGSAIPIAFFTPMTAVLTSLTLEALDLSQLTNNIFSTSISVIGNVIIKDCKLDASAIISPATRPVCTDMVLQVVRSDSAATSYKSARYTYEAVETTETSIVRTGGFVDPAGQAQSRKIVTTANTEWLRPYAAQPLAAWNATTGSSKTVTVYGTVNADALPNNDDTWLEVSGLTNASFPVGSTVTSGKANVWSANAAVASDGSTWTNPAYSTFNGLLTNGMTVSNSDRTITHAVTGDATGHSATFLGTGKRYLEMTLDTGMSSSNCYGLAEPGVVGVNSPVGTIVILNSGIVAINGVSTGVDCGFLSTTVGGGVIRIAIDLTARLVWFAIDGGNWNANASYSPATGVGGFTIPATGTYSPYAYLAGSSGHVLTMNCGQVAYAYTPPSGFGNWYAWTPFKLVATLTPNMAGYLIPQVKVAKASSTFYIDALAVVT